METEEDFATFSKSINLNDTKKEKVA